MGRQRPPSGIPLGVGRHRPVHALRSVDADQAQANGRIYL